jgi:hypothetical protein
LNSNENIVTHVAAAAAAVELSDFTKELRYCCQTCPYVYKITKKVTLLIMPGLCVSFTHTAQQSQLHLGLYHGASMLCQSHIDLG